MKVSCTGEIPKNKYKKKTSIPILKTQIKGRERSNQREKKTQAAATQADPSSDDPGTRAPGLGHASLRPRSRVSPRLGSRTVI